MRIVYWNIRAGGGVRIGGIADQIRRWRPDVVGLCEFRGTAASTALREALALQGLEYQLDRVNRRQPARNAVFLAARQPLREMRLARAPAERERWLVARLEAGPVVGVLHAPNYVTGRKLDFFGAVLETTGRWRHGPAVIGGDTNTGVPPLDGPAAAFHDWETTWIGELAQRGWFDAFRREHPRSVMPTWYSPNRQTGYRLDQAFVNRALYDRLKRVCYRWGRGGGPDWDREQPRAKRRDGLSAHAALLLDLD